MSWKVKDNGVKYWEYNTLSQFANLKHFTTGHEGGVSVGAYKSFNLALHTGDELENVIANRQKLAQALGIDLKMMVFPNQTHSKNVFRVKKSDAGKGAENFATAIPDTDALITNELDICLMILTADCVPVLLYDTENEAIGVVHAGWKGTMQNITGETVKAMQQEFSSNPANIVAAIGPSAGPDFFEVGQDVIDAALQSFEHQSDKLIIKRNGQTFFDLWQANKLQLTNAGVNAKNIEMSGLCTLSNPLFFSARNSGLQSGRIGTGIMLTN
jgi:YfiH family protein